MTFFVDTSVLLLAIGRESPDRDPARDFLERAARVRATIHISAEAAQEFVFHRTRRVGRTQAIIDGRRLSDTCVLHDFTADLQSRSLDLMDVSQVRGRDAVHAATALAAGFSEIVTCDRDFHDVPGLRGIHPRDAAVV